jgi:outer membrane protein TolC
MRGVSEARAFDAPADASLRSSAIVKRASLIALVVLVVARGACGQDAGQEPARVQAPEAPPASGAPGTEPAELEQVVGPTPGAPRIGLDAAVRLALQQNFGILDSADSVSASRFQESAARGEFLPRITPLYQRTDDSSLFGIDVAQKLPWTGGIVTATGRYLSQPEADAPFPKTTDLRLLLSQPLLRGFGPNATFFDLTNAKRARVGQERSFALARQRLAVTVAAAFYAVIAQRQLLEVARQSLERTDGLLKSSEARLQVGLASKLDVYRAELQASQARDAMVRSEAALETALERFRGLLALPPDNPVEPEAAVLPDVDADTFAPVDVLVVRALHNRLELAEARDLVGDAQRAASLARQNLFPQIDLNLGVTQLGYGGTFGDAWGAGDRRVELFLSAAFPLQQSAQKANRAVAELQLGSRERGVHEQELQIEQEVRQALRDLQQIRKSVELQQQAVEVAAQQRRLAVLRYQRGLGSNFDVVDAESSLVTARSALVQLLTSYAVARLDLKRTTGTLDVDTEFSR